MKTPIFGDSHSISLDMRSPLMNSPIFWEKLGEFDKILNNQTPLLRKKAEKILIQAGFAKVIGLMPTARAWECVPGKRL